MGKFEQVAEVSSAPLASSPLRNTSGGADDGAWDALSRAQDPGEFCTAWLAIQCGFLPGAVAALLLLDDDEGHFSTAAAWPDERQDLGYLSETARRTLASRTSFLAPRESGVTVQIGQPVESAGRLRGVVVVEVRQPQGQFPALLRQLRWGVGWLDVLFERRLVEEKAAHLSQSRFVIDVLAALGDQTSLQACGLALANELATRLDCCRVSVGLRRGRDIRLAAVSHSAVFGKRLQFAALLENAMDEAADQHASVTVPPTAGTWRRIALAHADLARRLSSTSVASIVMGNGVRTIGVILLERDRGAVFDADTVEALEALAALAAPLLEARMEGERFVSGSAVRGVGLLWRKLFGAGHPAFKLGTLAALAAAAYLALAEGEFRISAKAVVEGAVQRAVVAPFDGYVASAAVRAGDVVEAGQVLATIDDNDLKLEAARWKSDYEEQLLKYRDAFARQDRALAGVLTSSLEQSRARLSLVSGKLGRTAITAPFRGAVISGDLRQLIGLPVEKGKVLFEIAPLETFRVVLQVDERDIVYLSPGQSGTLVLTGLSNESLPLSIKSVTPVATAAEGRNFFKVEADMHGAALPLRPGMEGVGKLVVERRPLLAVWMRPLLDWLRITAWKWLP